MCLFCKKLKEQDGIIYENNTTFVIYDSYPVNKGHCLIIPKRHIENIFQTNEEEYLDIRDSIKHMKILLDELYSPDGYNIGINNGEAAGQSIMHLHIHLIPRYIGDVKNPRGGVRGVIPDKQNY